MIKLNKYDVTEIMPGTYYENGQEYLFTIQRDCTGILILWTEENPVDKDEAEKEILAEYMSVRN